jgi:hypothetical protein
MTKSDPFSYAKVCLSFYSASEALARQACDMIAAVASEAGSSCTEQGRAAAYELVPAVPGHAVMFDVRV